jgi:3-isopropylmalate/(R)-2-methylmalate dehydratase large subunit
VELGAKFGMFAADNVTADWLQTMAGKHSPPFGPDEEAEYANILELDVAALTPMVAAPHSVDKVKPASELGGVKIDQAVLGGCTNGHLSDLRLAANLMKGKKVHSDLRFLVIPASRKVELAALREGLLEALLESGAMLCPPTCGNCFGNHVGILAAGQKCISATNRNFQGRMGSPQAEIYLASPATVAASAITGWITDPRQL